MRNFERLSDNITDIIVELAVEDELPSDLTQLSPHHFEKVIPDWVKGGLLGVRDACYEAMDGSWEINDEGFEYMINTLDKISKFLHLDFPKYEKRED